VASDVERSKAFYTEVLGATIPDRDGGPPCVVLADTLIDIFQAKGDAQPSPGGRGQHHAYTMSLEDFDPWVEQLRKHNVPIELTTHRLHRMSIFLDDPDGYHFEFFVVFENDEIGRREIEKRGLLPKGA
jgi:catechol-2,3-dioxygenase